VRELSLARAGEEKVALLRRVDAAARAYDPRIVRVEAGYAKAGRMSWWSVPTEPWRAIVNPWFVWA
jgi:hypothetical protein